MFQRELTISESKALQFIIQLDSVLIKNQTSTKVRLYNRKNKRYQSVNMTTKQFIKYVKSVCDNAGLVVAKSGLIYTMDGLTLTTEHIH